MVELAFFYRKRFHFSCKIWSGKLRNQVNNLWRGEADGSENEEELSKERIQRVCKAVFLHSESTSRSKRILSDHLPGSFEDSR